MLTQLLFVLFLLTSLSSFGISIQVAKSYKWKENVQVWANKIGPLHRPVESQDFYQALPWSEGCKPKQLEYGEIQLGETLLGNRFVNTPFQLFFNESVDVNTLCELSLDSIAADTFRRAVEDNYVYYLNIDGISSQAISLGITDLQRVGINLGNKLDRLEHVYLYSHLIFDVFYNESNLIYFEVTPASPTLILPHKDFSSSVTYSVFWKPTHLRIEVWLNMRFYIFQCLCQRTKDRPNIKNVSSQKVLEFPWLSLFSPMIFVIFLIGSIGIICFRRLRHDLKSTREGSSVAVDQEIGFDDTERGWKLVKGDTISCMNNLTGMCIVVGVGLQLTVLVMILFIIGILGGYKKYGGSSFLSSMVITYFMTSPISGFASGRLYRQMNGVHWVRNALICIFVYTLPVFLVWSVLNTFALFYDSTMALPFYVGFSLFILWLFVAFPCTVLGVIVGKHTGRKGFRAPVRTSKIKREIPRSPWYASVWFQAFVSGMFPLSIVLVEMKHILNTLTGYENPSSFILLTVLFFILMVWIATISSFLVFQQVCFEDYRWWWRSFLNGGSCSIFFYLYSIYYFYVRSGFSGFLQVTSSIIRM
eukprot:jgi/Galph1/3627/GphlegSOOS_G2303.1